MAGEPKKGFHLAFLSVGKSKSLTIMYSWWSQNSRFDFKSMVSNFFYSLIRKKKSHFSNCRDNLAQRSIPSVSQSVTFVIVSRYMFWRKNCNLYVIIEWDWIFSSPFFLFWFRYSLEKPAIITSSTCIDDVVKNLIWHFDNRIIMMMGEEVIKRSTDAKKSLNFCSQILFDRWGGISKMILFLHTN